MLDIRYCANKNNTVLNAFSRLTRLKHDSNSLSENKNILENAINEYYYYNTIIIEISDEFKNNIKKNTIMKIDNRKFINVFAYTAVR
jgi:hypothetical protein